MKIVIDTKVVIAAFFFGGDARQIIEAVAQGKMTAYATREIVEEYKAVCVKMQRKRKKLRPNLLLPFTANLHIVETKPEIAAAYGDGKFISCAAEVGAVYVVDDKEDAALAMEGASVKIMIAQGLCQLLSLYA